MQVKNGYSCWNLYVKDLLLHLQNEDKTMKKVDIRNFTRFMGLSMLLRGLTVSPLKLQKILYYQQAWHLVFFGRENPLFNVAPQAWVNGPVYPEVYRVYKDKTTGMCDHLQISDFVNEGEDVETVMAELSASLQLSKEEEQLMDQVIMLYGSKTQNQLILLTHSERPWSEQREGLLPYMKSEKEISLDTMYQYYSDRYKRNRAKS